jgi:glycosyltransferase involved in cell wall biosynthesis
LLTKFTLNKGDLITCDGENTKEEMIKWGEKPQKIKIVYHGIGTEIFSPENKDEKVKEVLRIQNSPAVVSTRRLDSVYDVESLIKAIPLVLKQISDAKFIIAGEGSEEDYLKDLVESLGILDSIKFVGQIPHNELPRYLASSDVYVSTSLSDGGIAVSTLEAMACGLTPIVTDVGDNRKWIKDGKNGFVVPTKDPKSLAEKIIYLLENEDIRKEFGMMNRKIIEERNNYYKEMEKMENIYIRLIERYKR